MLEIVDTVLTWVLIIVLFMRIRQLKSQLVSFNEYNKIYAEFLESLKQQKVG